MTDSAKPFAAKKFLEMYLLDNSRQPLRPMPGGAQIEARGSLLYPLG
jgi:hypothetical protein